MNGKVTIESMAPQKLERLSEPQMPEKIIRFPDVYKRICPVFCMDRRTAKLVLRSMESEGMIEIVRKHGIRLKKEQKCYGYNGVR